jgi:signal transduction histidine kinase
MQASEHVNFWNARFASRALEAAFQRDVFARNLRNNTVTVGVVLFLYIGFIFTDFIEAESPADTIRVKLIFFVLCLGLLSTLWVERVRVSQDLVFAGAVTLLGISMNYVIWQQPTLENNYYIGLVQGNILFALLLRLNFPSMALVLLTGTLTFVAVASTKGQPELAMLQSANLGLVCLICMAGSYLLQRYQRIDYLKSQTIERQNEQLKELLKDAERDKERKIAALNMLVHFIKTPLHQIAGFSDILVNAASRSEEGEAAENARYIRSATTSLTKSVNGLLAYHRLDEAETRVAPEHCDLSAAVEDFCELLPENVKAANGIREKATVFVDPEILRAALKSFADYCADQKNDVSSLTLSLQASDAAWGLHIRDDARILSATQFNEAVQPLTKIETYLSHTGDQMPMSLRTVARAIDIVGGAFTHDALSDGNRYTISLPAAEAKAAA